MARKLRHASLCQGQAAANCQLPALANGDADFSADRDDTPELRHSKRGALSGAGDQPVPPARDVRLISSAADKQDADEPQVPGAGPDNLQTRSSSPQLRCSRRVQKRAYQVLASATRTPSLIVAYPLGGKDDQHYTESLDMTADVPSALGISCGESQASGAPSSEGSRRWSRALQTRPDSLLTRLAVAIREASDMTDLELLSSDGSHEDPLVYGMWKAVRGP
jgi:hypothetical protein